MIKTLRITTIIAAFLAVGLLAFPVVYGYRGDEEIEKFLKSPGAIEKFKKAKGAKVKTGSQVSPLVRQAVAFGEYIDPTPILRTIKRAERPPVASEKPSIPVPLGDVTIKFDLIGTSYYASRPELSLAYINEPGKGLHWVRQGSRVAHLLIEEVKDGSIIVKDREKTVTLAAVRAPKKSLIKGETTSTSTTTLPGASASITSSVPVAAGAGQSAVSVVEKTATAPPVDRRRLPQAGNSEQDADASLADFINELKAKQAGAGTGEGGSGYSEAEKAELKEAIATFESMRITIEEGNRLDRLGKELKQDRRKPVSAGGSKVGKSRGPQPPPRPPQPPPRPPQSPRRLPSSRPPSIPPK
jgi:hypothetical protein